MNNGPLCPQHPTATERVSGDRYVQYLCLQCPWMSTAEAQIPEAQQGKIAVQLDGCLFKFEGWDRIGQPTDTSIVQTQDLVFNGWDVVVVTARPAYEADMVESALAGADVPYSEIRYGEPLYAAYIANNAVPASAPKWRVSNG